MAFLNISIQSCDGDRRLWEEQFFVAAADVIITAVVIVTAVSAPTKRRVEHFSF